MKSICDQSNESYRAVRSCSCCSVYKFSLLRLWVKSKCDHSSESCWAVLSCGIVYYVVQGGSMFWVHGWNPKVWPFKWKLLKQNFPLVLFIILYRVVLTLLCGWNPKCEYSNESYWVVYSLTTGMLLKSPKTFQVDFRQNNPCCIL